MEEVKTINWTPFQAEFPNLFRNAEFRDMGVGEGWFEILWELCIGLEAIAARQSTEEAIQIAQVKEKFGTLRFYTRRTTNEAIALVEIAMKRSSSTCEACGQPGASCRKGAWMKTLCVADQIAMGAEPSHGGHEPKPQ